MQGLKGLVQLQVICEIALKLVNIISSFVTFLQFLTIEVVRQVLIRVNTNLIGSHIIRGPKSISISSHFLILPLRIIKNKLYTVELRILRIERIAFISQKVRYNLRPCSQLTLIGRVIKIEQKIEESNVLYRIQAALIFLIVRQSVPSQLPILKLIYSASIILLIVV